MRIEFPEGLATQDLFKIPAFTALEYVTMSA